MPEHNREQDNKRANEQTNKREEPERGTKGGAMGEDKSIEQEDVAQGGDDSTRSNE